MDITPIYDLRDRLRTAMIAGTSLLAEDFRLKRAVEAMAPLEKAAPVFAKVGEFCKKLIASGSGTEDKEDLLLDAITLVDAVCCTQGAVSVPGEMKSLFEEENAGNGMENIINSKKKMILSNVPYSMLQPLREALTTSGGGRYAYVTDCHDVSPELFKDYRVRLAMVQALNASYAELADDVCRWLIEDGEDVLPLLVRDFNPKGKKEMVRRLRIIEKWRGAAANDFYIKQLETAEGELRQDLIYALRHEPKNIELLMDLGKKERGNTKKVAYAALACNDNEEVEKFFEEMYRKKPKTVMEYLEMNAERNKTSWGARLAAKGLVDWLNSKPEKTGDKKKDESAMMEWEQTASHFVDALYGKSGAEVYDALRLAATMSGKYGTLLQKEILRLLCYLLITQPGEEIFSLVDSIYEGENGEKGVLQYFPAAFLSRVIRECGMGAENPGADYVDWLYTQLFEKTPCVPYHFLAQAFEYLRYRDGKYTFEESHYDNVMEYYNTYVCPINIEIKGKFLDLLIRCCDQGIDRKLALFFDSSDKEVCSKLEEYFYKRALSTPSDEYLAPLKRCGCMRCEGLLVHFIKSRPRMMSMWQIEYFVQNMPGSIEAKIAEASRIPELVNNGKIAIYSWSEKQYMNWLNGLV